MDLFQMALGLLPPWMVVRSTFDAAAKRLDIHLDFPKGSRFVCPNCGASDCRAYETEEMTWCHLNFFQHEALSPRSRASSELYRLWDQAGVGAIGVRGRAGPCLCCCDRPVGEAWLRVVK
jgi:hypothetical protein